MMRSGVSNCSTPARCATCVPQRRYAAAGRHRRSCASTCLALLLAHGADARRTDHSGHCAALARRHAPRRSDPAGAARRWRQPDSHCAGRGRATVSPRCAPGNSTVVQTLLAAGADVEATDQQGQTPLMLAAAAGNVELRAGAARASCAARGAGSSAAHGAVARRLVGHAANRGCAAARRRRSERGRRAGSDARCTPRRLTDRPVWWRGCCKPVRASICRTAARRYAAADGRSQRQEEAVKALLAQVAALDLQNNAGDTALIAASRGGYRQHLSYAVARGCQPRAAQWRARLGRGCRRRTRLQEPGRGAGDQYLSVASLERAPQ